LASTSAWNCDAIAGSAARRPLSITARSRFFAASLNGAPVGVRATPVIRSNTCCGTIFGLSANWRICAFAATSPSERISPASVCAVPFADAFMRASAYGLAMVASSAMSSAPRALELRLQLAEEVGMRARIDLAAQDLLGAAHGERGDVLAQRLARTRGLLLGLGARGGDDLGALFVGARLGFLDHRLREALGVGEALRGVGARRRKLLFGELVRRRQLGLGLVGGREAVADLLRALVERGGDRRPHELHREQGQDHEHDHLDPERCGDAHGLLAEWFSKPALAPAQASAGLLRQEVDLRKEGVRGRV